VIVQRIALLGSRSMFSTGSEYGNADEDRLAEMASYDESWKKR
jgi:hypothetical protein